MGQCLMGAVSWAVSQAAACRLGSLAPRPSATRTTCPRDRLPPMPVASGVGCRVGRCPRAGCLRGRVPPGPGVSWGGVPKGVGLIGRVPRGAVPHGRVPGGRMPPRVLSPETECPQGPDAPGTDCLRGRVPPWTGDLDAIS